MKNLKKFGEFLKEDVAAPASTTETTTVATTTETTTVAPAAQFQNVIKDPKLIMDLEISDCKDTNDTPVEYAKLKVSWLKNYSAGYTFKIVESNIPIFIKGKELDIQFGFLDNNGNLTNRKVYIGIQDNNNSYFGIVKLPNQKPY